MNRLRLYAILEGFDADRMDPREYLARRHGITDPKMQDVWLHGNPPPETPRPPTGPQTLAWHSLLSVARDICYTLVHQDVAQFFDMMARDFLPAWSKLLTGATPELMVNVRKLIGLMRTASGEVERAISGGGAEDYELPGTPIRSVEGWRGSEDRPADLQRGLAHPASLRNVTMLRSDRCTVLVRSVVQESHALVAGAILDIIEALYEEENRVGDFSADFGASMFAIRALMTRVLQALE